MQNPEQTISFQFGGSPTITALIELFNETVDPTNDINNIYEFVWNVNTAQGFGLDILGAIVNVNRVVYGINNDDYFGFTQEFEPFDQAPFADSLDQNPKYVLDDTTYRTVILVKALANISATNAQSINKLLQKLFLGRGRCYSLDLGGMRMQYTFEFALTPVEYAILKNTDILPHPAGVKVYIYQFPVHYFGYKAPANYWLPFNQGIFFNPVTGQ